MTEPRWSTEPRWDLIRRLRKQIAEGTYETEQRQRRAVRNLNRRLTIGLESASLPPDHESEHVGREDQDNDEQRS